MCIYKCIYYTCIYIYIYIYIYAPKDVLPSRICANSCAAVATVSHRDTDPLVRHPSSPSLLPSQELRDTKVYEP